MTKLFLPCLQAVALLLSMPVLIAQGDEPAQEFAELNPAWLVTREEALQWGEIKNANLPAISGSPEWKNYLEFL